MTVACPHGHTSETADYCDQCGARIEPTPAATATPPTSVLEPVSVPEPCPACGTARSGNERFCEACGYDYTKARPRAPEPGAATAWEAVVSADRALFDRHTMGTIAFPGTAASRVIALDRPEFQIGRRSATSDIRPDIDLAEAPEDPAVSHSHASLVRQDDGSYAVIDLSSTNGTTINDQAEPIAANTSVPLADGDRILLGAFTAITVRAVRGSD